MQKSFFLSLCLIISLFSSNLFANDWVSQAVSAANSSAAGSSSGGNCVPGTQEQSEQSDYTPYEETQQHSTQCNGGETWADCSRRLFLGK